MTILECQLFNFDYPHDNLDQKKCRTLSFICNTITIPIDGALQTCKYNIDYSSTFCCSRQLNNDRATIGCSNRVAIEKWGEILCINILCLELVVETAMELVKGGGDRGGKSLEREGSTSQHWVNRPYFEVFRNINISSWNVHILKFSMLSNTSP